VILVFIEQRGHNHVTADDKKDIYPNEAPFKKQIGVVEDNE
jgi:hypothetical protein